MIHDCIPGDIQKEGYLHFFTDSLDSNTNTISSSRESESINTLSSEGQKEEDKKDEDTTSELKNDWKFFSQTEYNSLR